MMNHRHKNRLFLLLATIGLLGFGTAQAQPYGMMGWGGHCPQAQGQGKGTWQPMDAKARQARTAEHLDRFKAELKITAAQESAWQSFAEKARQQFDSMPEQCPMVAANTTPTTPLSAPERMDKGIEFMKQRLTRMEAMSAAMKDLYAALTPEQKTVADQHFNRSFQSMQGQGRGQGRGRMMQQNR